ncbi:ORF104 [Saltwater crocodilepox virus]|nr:ORF104 [Saltwater crocodilepox virus]QGT47832.1 ORF104 [Saltwater crocodilepox virus]QGT48042.1 ORF104 [Saltwater crocodilepox virus]QGT48256.1 ORF104 [Saltwater crocodilepox virus]QGT48472.1 ORF104 [Saltwater crocodilepox virus]
MGASLSVSSRVPTRTGHTAEMDLNAYAMLNALHAMAAGEDRAVGYMTADQVPPLRKLLPEFDVAEEIGGLYRVRRRTFLADPARCCADPRLGYYWETADGKTSPYYDYLTDPSLRTCDPRSRDLLGSDYCDAAMKARCAGGTDGAALCSEWIAAAVVGRGSRDVNNFMAARCRADVTRPLCEDWLHALRVANTRELDAVADGVLMRQPADFKSARMRCSFPSAATLTVAARVIEPRECWDPNCVNGNANFFLSENYRNLSLCSIYKCNIDIASLRMDPKSRLMVSCRDALKDVDAKKIDVVRENVARSFALNRSYFLLVFVAILIIAFI